MYLHVSAYLLWAAIGLPTLSVGLPGLCVGEVGRPVHTGQLVDASTVQKVNVLCACMSHWVGNDFQQQQQWQQLQQQTTTTYQACWQACPSCAFECVKLAGAAQNTHTPCCATSMTHTTRRGTHKTTLSIFIHTHTHIHSCYCLSAPCLLVYLLHIFKDTTETATARGTSCDIPVWWASTLSPHVTHKLNSINSCSPPACLID